MIPPLPEFVLPFLSALPAGAALELLAGPIRSQGA